MDYQLARLLACEVVTEKPFEPIGDEAFERATALVESCPRVINAGVTIGTQNARIQQILDLAEKMDKLERL